LVCISQQLWEKKTLNKPSRSTLLQFAFVTLACLALYLPFLSLQYDTNGLIEALAVESGQLFHKNHLLYRVVGYAAYRGLQFAGYSGRAIVVLQVLNAVCGALGVGFAYTAYKRVTHRTAAALAGALLFGGSFIYWLFSTDVSYVTMAAVFAGASMAVLLSQYSRSRAVLAGILTALSVLTWQASIFLIPSLVLLSFLLEKDIPIQKRRQTTTLYAATACLVSGLAYVVVAVSQHGLMKPTELVRWFTGYGEGGTLPMWGRWDFHGPLLAASAAVDSIVPTPLAIPLRQLSFNVQLGRIAVDVAIVGFGLLTVLAVLRTRVRALWFLAAYLFFLPFIIWWDPSVSKWSLVPNLFLAGFFAVSLDPWFRNRYATAVIFATLLFVGATNFITTIRPRHRDIGQDRRVAQCVADHMKPNDLLIAAEWGWPDYLEYLHGRMLLSAISHFADARDWVDHVHSAGGTAYIVNPNTYSEAHYAWLQSQTGVRREDLVRLAGSPAFSCYGTEIFTVRTPL